MKVHFVTIVLNGMPFVSWIYPILRQLKLDWHWWVMEGAALPQACTSWCAEIEPQLSVDGTLQYLANLASFDKRVTHLARPSWPGKAAMFNDALNRITDGEFLLFQVDSDEIWTSEQFEKACALMERAVHLNCMFFRCRYFVGPDLVITSREGFGNHTAYEWKRLWKVKRGAWFESHEPPKLAGFEERPWLQSSTEKLGLVFDHFAYATEQQMAFKQRYYGSSNNLNGALYKDAVVGWKKLQKAAMPVAELSHFLPWVGPAVRVEKLASRPAIA